MARSESPGAAGSIGVGITKFVRCGLIAGVGMVTAQPGDVRAQSVTYIGEADAPPVLPTANLAEVQKRWASELANAVRRHWLRPDDLQTTFQCQVNIRLTPTGQVERAKIASSCGSLALDGSVIKAVYKASPLPLPTEPSAFVPDLTIRFRP